MDDITYDNVVEMEEFKNKKRINTPVYKLIRECEAVLEKELQDRAEICNKKFEELGVTGVSFQKINFNPHNGLPVTTLLTYEDVFGKIPSTNNTSSAVIYNQDFPEKGLVPCHTIFGSDDDDYLPPAC